VIDYRWWGALQVEELMSEGLGYPAAAAGTELLRLPPSDGGGGTGLTLCQFLRVMAGFVAELGQPEPPSQ
jgi:hypothetical protein